MNNTLTIPLFPLSTVLFPGGFLPLRIFEPRYLEMVRRCQESESGFGVVFIQEGSEVHDENKGLPELSEIGTLADLVQVNEVEKDQLEILTVGGAKFRIEATWEDNSHLRMGEVTFLPDEKPGEPLSEDDFFMGMLNSIIEFPQLPSYIKESVDRNDIRDVSNRLAEFINFSMPRKQELLEIEFPRQRLVRIREWLDSDHAQP